MSSQDNLFAARQKLKQSGKSPREIGKESLQKVLDWIYKWGFTSSSNINALLNRTSGGYADRLVSQGLLIRTKNTYPVPRYIYTLSAEGIRLAENNSDKQFPYPELNTQRLTPRKYSHDLHAQLETIYAMKDGFISGFETERMFHRIGDLKGVKRPDVIWLIGGEFIYGVEVELDGKWAMDLDVFIERIIKALEPDGKGRSQYDKFIIYFDSTTKLKRYKAAMQPGSPLNLWEKNKRNYWEICEVRKVPDWLSNKVEFLMVGEATGKE